MPVKSKRSEGAGVTTSLAKKQGGPSGRRGAKVTEAIRRLGAQRDQTLWRDKIAGSSDEKIPPKPIPSAAEAQPTFWSSLPVRVTKDAKLLIAKLRRDGIVRVKFPKMPSAEGELTGVAKNGTETTIGILRLLRAKVESGASLAGFAHAGIFVSTPSTQEGLLIFEIRVPKMSKSIQARDATVQGGMQHRLARSVEALSAERRIQ